MFIATAVLSALFAALLLFSALGKLRRDPAQMRTMRTVGFPERRVWLLAVAETAGAAGLIAGLFWWPLGVAAAAGTIAYFVGAAGSHLRVRDHRGIAPAVVLTLVGVAALVLRALSA
jgi:uncharacterized membrane protein YphA (DoxX/SURF4 family)